MGAAEERAVLESYETWRAETVADGPDVSIEKFLAEREAANNARRIVEAERSMRASIANIATGSIPLNEHTAQEHLYRAIEILTSEGVPA